jgi:outer membrane protein OmpA-like peptidoglycan-associated protein/tetratricopeptide (TPR) repeat protein
MRTIIITISLIFLTLGQSIAQNDIKFKSGNFPGKGREVRQAKADIKEGDYFVSIRNYDEALLYYMKAQEFNSNNSELNFKIGFAFYNTSQKYDCLSYFDKAYSLNNKVDRKILYYLGRGNHLNYNFDKALEFYSEYARELKDNEEIASINRYIIQVRNAKILVQDTVNVEILNLGENVNSEYREYAPLVTSDGSTLYFTSRRKGSTGGKTADDGMFFEDIYVTQKTETGWTQARGVGRPLNTPLHDAAVGLSPDGQQLFIYMDQNGGDIFVSQLRGSRWLRPECLGESINSPYHDSKAALSFDNKTLYFISDRTDLSLGGRDIFYSEIDENGDWGQPKNIGSTVNTEYDEVDIFLHPDGRTMYFSSQGHNSMGGLDIFKTTRNENGNWTTPVNLGHPINTPGDDAFFVTTASGRTAYFASVRPEGHGLHDIYQINFIYDEKQPEEKREKVLVTLVKGVVKDAVTEIPLEADVEIIDNKKDEVVANFVTNTVTGGYLVNLPSGKNYGINVSKAGYLFHSENFNLPDTAEYQEFVVNIDLKRIEIGTSIVLRNIFFDYDKETLRPESFSELNRVVDILNNHPKLKIEISGHTDNRGSKEYNYQLSQARAKSVVDYLIEKGIERDRLEFKGYDFQKPIADNESEEGRQLNRRVEFKILSN